MSDSTRITEGPALLRSKEAARFLRISERSLWKLTARGEIPVVRFGRAVRYCPKALARIIEKGGIR